MNEMTAVTQATAKAPGTLTLPDTQTVTAVRHYTDRLFSFRVTRPASLPLVQDDVLAGLDASFFDDAPGPAIPSPKRARVA